MVDARLGKEKVVEEVKKVTQNLGAEASLNFSDQETAAATAIAVTRNHGVMVQMAQPVNISIPFGELIFRHIKIHGSLTGQCSTLKVPQRKCRRYTDSRKDCLEILHTVSKHKIKVQTHPFNGLKKLQRLSNLPSRER